MKRGISASAAAPAKDQRFRVGELVDVLCDHTRAGERVRDWLQGVVVQADRKMLAIQFVDDVYLTDGWMVPDRVLWCQQSGVNIRPSTKRRVRRPVARRKVRS
ncbi:MAG: hypothetical protein NTU91_06935 [Chloroflexi bacterium]|jgi:hypothetical protein|nr:hypothetical protein [Chloroflexota bacterium]